MQTTSVINFLADVEPNDVVIVAYAQVNHRLVCSQAGRIVNVFSVLEIINLAKRISFILYFFLASIKILKLCLKNIYC